MTDKLNTIDQTEFQRGYQAGLKMNELYLDKSVRLLAERDKYKETLEQIDSMAATPQWRDEPLWRIAEFIEAALIGDDDG